MDSIRFDQLGSVLTFAIGPMVLVSGCGLLLLSMTNRLGRVIDLARSIARHLRTSPDEEAEALRLQLRMLVRRVRLLRAAIALTALSALFAAILVVELFIAALLDVESVWTSVVIFCASMGCLIAALIVFMGDINAVLHALKVEIGDEWPEGDR